AVALRAVAPDAHAPRRPERPVPYEHIQADAVAVVAEGRAPVRVSASKTDGSWGPRVSANEWTTTMRPSPLIAGYEASSSAPLPRLFTLRRSVVPATRSRTKTSTVRFPSSGTRFGASESKASRAAARVAIGHWSYDRQGSS